MFRGSPHALLCPFPTVVKSWEGAALGGERGVRVGERQGMDRGPGLWTPSPWLLPCMLLLLCGWYPGFGQLSPHLERLERVDLCSPRPSLLCEQDRDR